MCFFRITHHQHVETYTLHVIQQSKETHTDTHTYTQRERLKQMKALHYKEAHMTFSVIFTTPGTDVLALKIPSHNHPQHNVMPKEYLT